jgi:probable rRNA maturation factor
MDSSSSESVEPNRASGVATADAGAIPEVTLLNHQRAAKVDLPRLRKFLQRLLSTLGTAPFSVRLVSDRVIRRFNKQYRGKDSSTDVLSFPAESGRSVDDRHSDRYLGDILISVETAERNARSYGLSQAQELEILTLHGLLHLMGYDHETDGGSMARKERFWSARLGLPLSLTDRARVRRSDRRATAKYR